MSDFLSKNKVLLIGSAVVFAAIYFFGAFESCESSDEVATLEVPVNVEEPTIPAITTVEAANEAQPQKIEPIVVADEVVVPLPNVIIKSEVDNGAIPEVLPVAIEDVRGSSAGVDQPTSVIVTPPVNSNNQ